MYVSSGISWRCRLSPVCRRSRWQSGFRKWRVWRISTIRISTRNLWTAETGMCAWTFSTTGRRVTGCRTASRASCSFSTTPIWTTPSRPISMTTMQKGSFPRRSGAPYGERRSTESRSARVSRPQKQRRRLRHNLRTENSTTRLVWRTFSQTKNRTWRVMKRTSSQNKERKMWLVMRIFVLDKNRRMRLVRTSFSRNKIKRIRSVRRRSVEVKNRNFRLVRRTPMQMVKLLLMWQPVHL